MGTPKRKAVVFFEKTFERPTLGEKIRLLELGKETGKTLNVEKLADVLEEVKKILLPLVESLSKLISSEPYFANNPLPRNFQNRRGAHLFESRSVDIWLERTGKWFLRLRVETAAEGWILREFDSRQLAGLIIQRRDDFLKDSLKRSNFLDEVPYLKKIAYYNAMFVFLVDSFFKSANELIKRKEEKLCVMREWLELLGYFGKSLDPLISQRKKAVLKDYEIWEEVGDHGDHNYVSSYFSSEALKPFWELIEKRRDGRSFKERTGLRSFSSLSDILDHMNYIVKVIEDTKSDGRTDAAKQCGYNSGRLPFSDEEVAVLKEFAGSIAPEK